MLIDNLLRCLWGEYDLDSSLSYYWQERWANDISSKDNMEIVAFARAHNVDVKVYQQEFAMQFSGNDENDELRQLIHIAYHASNLQ